MTDVKQLDAHDALMYLAEAFDGADENGCCVLLGDHVYCRCSAAKSLMNKGLITTEVHEQLQPQLCGESFRDEYDANRAAAWCRSEAAKLRPADVVPATRVRCWNNIRHEFILAYEPNGRGINLDYDRKTMDDSANKYEHMNAGMLGYEEITTDAALDLLRDWPEGRERFLQYCREHPPEPMEQPAGVVVTREWLSEVASVLTHCQVHWFACVKTEADPSVNGLWKVLGEMAERLAADARRKAGG